MDRTQVPKASAGVRSATYSSIPVYEITVKTVPIMLRKSDSYVNATQILRASGLPKANRTKVLEKEVCKGVHEKVQGGYAGSQGTWVPLETARQLAVRFNIASECARLFEYDTESGAAEAISPPSKSRRATTIKSYSEKIPTADGEEKLVIEMKRTAVESNILLDGMAPVISAASPTTPSVASPLTPVVLSPGELGTPLLSSSTPPAAAAASSSSSSSPPPRTASPIKQVAPSPPPRSASPIKQAPPPPRAVTPKLSPKQVAAAAALELEGGPMEVDEPVDVKSKAKVVGPAVPVPESQPLVKMPASVVVEAATKSVRVTGKPVPVEEKSEIVKAESAAVKAIPVPVVVAAKPIPVAAKPTVKPVPAPIVVKATTAAMKPTPVPVVSAKPIPALSQSFAPPAIVTPAAASAPSRQRRETTKVRKNLNEDDDDAEFGGYSSGGGEVSKPKKYQKGSAAEKIAQNSPTPSLGVSSSPLGGTVSGDVGMSRQSSSAYIDYATRDYGRVCQYCGTMETPQWRRGPGGKRTLCNACGVKWSSGRLHIPASRLPPLGGFASFKNGHAAPPPDARSPVSVPAANSTEPEADDSVSSYGLEDVEVGSTAWKLQLEVARLKSKLRETEKNHKKLTRLLSEGRVVDKGIDRAYRKILSRAKAALPHTVYNAHTTALLENLFYRNEDELVDDEKMQAASMLQTIKKNVNTNEKMRVAFGDATPRDLRVEQALLKSFVGSVKRANQRTL